MLARQHFSLRRFAAYTIVAAALLSNAQFVSAQDDKRSSMLTDTVRGVVVDPSTYAPSLISYHATMRDWNTSQPFFQNGYVEHNARFTITGQPDDRAVSYRVGRAQIFKDAAAALGMAAAQNATSRLVEHALLSRYPDHRKAVKTLGWIQRISVASLMSYRLSADHYRQADANIQRAAELGLR
jgi:hypothetical protein